ncbi:bifunctional adenosylcobinamide kinase/adenosylcobinamide-phosphate guanylyltransferase [Thermoactinomyces mirandus]|uniref:Adenosylcobinamide kinase n=1 Tax=Thermoactinomyces mirandus TaxID=2756294 RepID=A0A7W2AQG9_9BACL|nr:bifunctional adenosylcobinamide kinase/adenosylcobinamide-phosphate guanylyltransferase [Thermoactinomyces mirandus]MBA4601493.1 bifunctional adenosylcobinamide kinase/adenosylcobinamide-phosphate guanylyltransferase [Thermoactinomyces mirandus]
MGIRLVTGGVRSGKSRFAESLCMDAGNVTYIATGTAEDEEMRARIEIHRQRRPAHWNVVEEPFDLAQAIGQIPPEHQVLLDSVTTWVSYGLSVFGEKEWSRRVERETESWLKSLEQRETVIVTDEIGLGGVAMHPVSRAFQDTLGWVNQKIAGQANEVWLVIAGIPWRVKK